MNKCIVVFEWVDEWQIPSHIEVWPTAWLHQCQCGHLWVSFTCHWKRLWAYIVYISIFHCISYYCLVIACYWNILLNIEASFNITLHFSTKRTSQTNRHNSDTHCRKPSCHPHMLHQSAAIHAAKVAVFSPFRLPGSAALLYRRRFWSQPEVSLPLLVCAPLDCPHRRSSCCHSPGSSPPDRSLAWRSSGCGSPSGRRSGHQSLWIYYQTRPRRCKTSRRISAAAPGRRCPVGRDKPAGRPLSCPGFPCALPWWSPAQVTEKDG